jgi:integrase
MLQIDLEEAGIVARDDHQIVDFHALRTTFITGLARAGVAPALAQKLARHSDINLTLNAYTRLQMNDLAGAVGRLTVVALPRTQHEPRLTAPS